MYPSPDSGDGSHTEDTAEATGHHRANVRTSSSAICIAAYSFFVHKDQQALPIRGATESHFFSYANTLDRLFASESQQPWHQHRRQDPAPQCRRGPEWPAEDKDA